MTEEEYAKQERVLGVSVHESSGIWWKRIGPQYCKPAFDFQQIPLGVARPARARSMLGYAHLLAEGDPGNHALALITMERDVLASFSIRKLRAAERSQVRRGLENVEVRQIDDLEQQLDALRDINISQATRTSHGLPASYYTEHHAAWQNYIKTLHSLSGRVWLGAYVDNVVVAYYYYYQVGSTVVIDTAKSNSEYLRLRPNSALLFTLIERARDSGSVSRIVYGGRSANQNLDRFKKRYCFSERNLQVFRKETLAGRVARESMRRLGPDVVGRWGMRMRILQSRLAGSKAQDG